MLRALSGVIVAATAFGQNASYPYVLKRFAGNNVSGDGGPAILPFCNDQDRWKELRRVQDRPDPNAVAQSRSGGSEPGQPQGPPGSSTARKLPSAARGLGPRVRDVFRDSPTLRARPVLRAEFRPGAAIMNLSYGCMLVYVLRDSGCAGRLFEGRVERLPAAGSNVYDA